MANAGIQNYVDLAVGLTRAATAKAQATAKSLLAAVGLEEAAADATDRAGRLTEEVIAASRANHELMGKLVAAEVDRAAARVGFVRAEELDEVRRELADLRRNMAYADRDADGSQPSTPSPFAADAGAPDLGIPDPPAPVEALLEPDDAPPIETIAEPVLAAEQSRADDSPGGILPPPRKSAAKKAPAQPNAAKLAPTQKAAAKKAPAKKTQVRAPSAKAATTAPAQHEPSTETPDS